MEIIPRYEFRAFALNFGIVEERFRAGYQVSQIRESNEVYFLGRQNDILNFKFRNNILDIKQLVKEEDGLEQWKPVFKERFPLKKETIANYLETAFGIDIDNRSDQIGWNEWIKILTEEHCNIVIAHIFKKRTGFDLGEVQGELADVFVNGALTRSASLESENKELVLNKIIELELTPYENVNYVKALKKITGLILPDVFDI